MTLSFQTFIGKKEKKIIRSYSKGRDIWGDITNCLFLGVLFFKLTTETLKKSISKKKD